MMLEGKRVKGEDQGDEEKGESAMTDVRGQGDGGGEGAAASADVGMSPPPDDTVDGARAAHQLEIEYNQYAEMKESRAGAGGAADDADTAVGLDAPTAQGTWASSSIGKSPPRLMV